MAGWFGSFHPQAGLPDFFKEFEIVDHTHPVALTSIGEGRDVILIRPSVRPLGPDSRAQELEDLSRETKR